MLLSLSQLVGVHRFKNWGTSCWTMVVAIIRGRSRSLAELVFVGSELGLMGCSYSNQMSLRIKCFLVGYKPYLDYSSVVTKPLTLTHG
jgi:hypothetical protein